MPCFLLEAENPEVAHSAGRYLLPERTPSVSGRQIVCFDSQTHKLCIVGAEGYLLSMSAPLELGEGRRLPISLCLCTGSCLLSLFQKFKSPLPFKVTKP